jgi:hypothetical protein
MKMCKRMLMAPSKFGNQTFWIAARNLSSSAVATASASDEDVLYAGWCVCYYV